MEISKIKKLKSVYKNSQFRIYFFNLFTDSQNIDHSKMRNRKQVVCLKEPFLETNEEYYAF